MNAKVSLINFDLIISTTYHYSKHDPILKVALFSIFQEEW